MWDAMSREWTQMDISDPIDFLGRWQAALIMANTDGSMVHGALAQFRKMPGAITNKKTPGYVRLDEYGGKLGAFVPSKTFVREDLADEFQRMSEFISEARVAGGPTGDITTSGAVDKVDSSTISDLAGASTTEGGASITRWFARNSAS